MQQVSFRTQDTSATVGYPTRAKPCRCHRQVVDRNDGTCITCGHVPAELIDQEWSQQQWRNLKEGRQSTRRPFREVRKGTSYRLRFDRRVA